MTQFTMPWQNTNGLSIKNLTYTEFISSVFGRLADADPHDHEMSKSVKTQSLKRRRYRSDECMNLSVVSCA